MTVAARRAPAGRLSIRTQDVLSLRFGLLWAFFWDQGVAFQAMCFYLFIEYVRPQQLFSMLSGAPLGQVALGIALAAYIGSGEWFGMKGLGSWLMLLFTGVILASSLTAYDPSMSYDGMRLWVSWLVIYFLIINVVNTEQRFAFFALVWMMCHYYMSQGGAKQFAFRGFRFTTWGIIGAPGWFANSGEFGIAMCMFVAVSWHFYIAAKPYLNKWRKLFVLGMPGTAALGVIGSSSRGALLGMGAIVFYALLRSKQFVRTIIGIAVFAAAVWFILPAEQKARFNSAGEDRTSVMRKVYWLNGLDMARTHPVLGVGYNNWMKYYFMYYRESAISQKYDVYTVQVPHNIFIQCMAELGYIGLAVLVLLIAGTLWINYQTRVVARTWLDPPPRFVVQMAYALDGAMLSYIVAGFFVTVLYYPFFWINLAMTVALNAIAQKRGVAQGANVRHAGTPRRGPVRRGRMIAPP